jgi:predicted PurR-regulated permease PerM
VEQLNPTWLVRSGLRSWLLLGVLGIAAVSFVLIDALSAFVLPLICAFIVGMLFAPVVQWLAARHVPAPIGAALVMTGLALVVFVSALATVEGIVEQAPLIKSQVQDGASEIQGWLTSSGLTSDQLDDAAKQADELPRQVYDGALGNVGSIFSSIGAFFFGLFTFVFLLYYTLTDWAGVSTWIGRSLGVRPQVGAALVESATRSVRLYFGGVTISSLIVAVVIGLTLHLLGLPLAFTIALVTFVSAYIPYLGAIVSGAFAFVVALGSGGIDDAIIVLAVVLITQNVLQAIIQTRITSQTMQVHPIVNFGAAIVGAITAGAVGAIIAPPLAATLLGSKRILAQHAAGDADAVDPVIA